MAPPDTCLTLPPRRRAVAPARGQPLFRATSNEGEATGAAAPTVKATIFADAIRFSQVIPEKKPRRGTAGAGISSPLFPGMNFPDILLALPTLAIRLFDRELNRSYIRLF